LELNHGRDARATVWSTNLTLNAATSTSFRLPAAFTAKLAPGRYELRAEMSGFTCVGQAIRIGPGLAARSPFRTTRYGDYDGYVSKASLWEFADKADAMLARSQALGVNQYINRIAAGGYPLAFTKDSDGLELERKLEARLSGDPTGVAPEKAVFGFPQAHVLGGYSAFGLREWLLLVGMDAALPIGTSTGYAKGQKPEEYAATIKSFTEALMDFPAFAGWDWVANWWVTDAKLRFAHAPDSAATTPAPAPRLPAPGEATPANDEWVLDELDSAPKTNAAKSDPKATGAKKVPTSQNSEQAEYEEAFKKANETGVWHPILDTVGDRVVGWQADAQQMFKDALHKVAPALSTSASGPYRRPEVYPPASFANVDEVDLHFQAEQIGCPSWTAHAADYYKRPNKPAWIHPELWNDTGTGEQILPMSWLAIMRGVDGIGASGNTPNWGAQPTDARSGYPGIPSVFRALNTFARQYGPWLTTLENADRIAIPVSYRHVKGDWWMGIGGRYFTRLWEAHMSCLYARQPATFIYPEDKPDLRRFKALLMVSQRFELDPALADMLAQAKKLGLTIFTDGNCREGLMTDSTPLGVSFDRIEKLKSMNADSTYWPFSSTLLEQAAAVAKTLDAVVPPVGTCDQPEVVLSERRSGEVRFVWVVNNTFTALDPGKLWRVQTAVATHTPVVAKVTLPVNPGEVVYDVFAEREVSGFRVQGSGGNGVELTSDLRFSHARLYAILPQAITKVKVDVPGMLNPGQTFTWTAAVPGIEAKLPLHVVLRDGAGALVEERYATTGTGTLTVPINAVLPISFTATELLSGKTEPASALTSDFRPLSSLFGPRLRDMAISPDGSTGLLNAFDWGQNLYALDLGTGKVRWTGNVGDHFAYAPLATPAGFAAQGYDFKSGEGYHLYQLSRDGAVQRRFALPGIPARFSGWAFPLVEDRISNFTAAPDGTWVAGAGNLALAVWSPDGQLLWSQNWAATDRTVLRLAAAGNNSLIVSRGMQITGYEARTGREQWTMTPDSSGAIGRLSVSADGRTVVASASTLSGRIFVLRDGKLVGTLPTGADDAVVTADGNWVALSQGSLLKLYAADGSLRWTCQGDDTLRFPRLSPDGKRLAVGSELGTLYVFEVPSGSQRMLDLGALPVTAWLPDGDLVAATWMGTVVRFDGNLKEKWRVRVGDAPQSANQQSQISNLPRPVSPPGPTPSRHLCRSRRICSLPMR
jgi:outer membrane protein assembly factor BamB